jgi:hypothetical protein
MSVRTYKIILGILAFALVAIFVNFYLVPRWTGKAALQSFTGGGGITFPTPPNIYSGTFSWASFTMATSSIFGDVLIAPKTGSISRIGFRGGTVTVSSTLNIKIETVSATSGLPTGVLWGAGTSGDIKVATSNIYYYVALDTAASVNKGDLFAITVNVTSTAASSSINMVNTTVFPCGLPHMVSKASSGAAWAKSQAMTAFAVEYSDGSYAQIPGVAPFDKFTSQNYSTSTSPKEIALAFSFPFPVRVRGGWISEQSYASTSLQLYDSNGTTVLASSTINASTTFAASSNSGTKYFLFPTSVTLSKNTTYRLSTISFSSVNQGLNYISVTTSSFSTNQMNQIEGGTDFYWSQKATSGAPWVNIANQRPMIGLILDQFDDAVQ